MPDRTGRDQLLAALTVVALGLAGLAAGVWCAFLVPARLPGGLPGAADVLALLAAGGLGALGVWGTGSIGAGVVPGVVMLVVTALAGRRTAGGGLVVPGSIGTDPTVGTVGVLLILAELVGTAAALLTGRWTLHSRARSAEDKERDRAR